MDLPGKWEFPGGKLLEDESAELCIVREIQEELSVAIEIYEKLPSVQHIYGDKTVELIPFRAKIIAGEIVLTEHAALRWVDPDELLLLNCAEADVAVLNDYLALIKSRQPRW